MVRFLVYGFRCTTHKELLNNFVQGKFEDVIIGNGQDYKIIGRSTIQLKLYNGEKLLLYDVRDISYLKYNYMC